MNSNRTQILKWAMALYAVTTLISMAVMNIGAALLVLALFYVLVGRPKGIRVAFGSARRYFSYGFFGWASLSLGFAIFLSLFVAWYDPPGYGENFVQIEFLKDLSKAWYLAWPFVLAVALRELETDDRRFVIRAWLGAFGVISLIGIAQFWTGWPRPQGIPFLSGHYFHATLFLGHHLSVASIWIFPFFAALDFLIDRSRPAILPRRLLFLLAAVGGVTLILGFSRTLWAALPIGLLLWFVIGLPWKRAWAAVALVLVLAAAAWQVPLVKQRVAQSIGVGPRIELWEKNLQIFKDYPVTGAGWHHGAELTKYLEQFRNPTRTEIFMAHAHNNFLEMLGSTGVVGLLAWLIWNAVWVGLLIPAKARGFVEGVGKGPYFGRALLCTWFVFQLNGLTQVNFWEAKVLHQLTWATAWLLVWAMESEV